MAQDALRLSSLQQGAPTVLLAVAQRWFLLARIQLAPLMVALELAAVCHMCPTRRGDVYGSSWGHGRCASAELNTDVMHRTWYLSTDPKIMDEYISGLLHNPPAPARTVFLWQALKRV